MIVDRNAEQLAFVDRRRPPVDAGARRRGFDLSRSAPDLTSRRHVNREGPLPVDGIHHAVVDNRSCEFSEIIHDADIPDGRQPSNVAFVDLLQWAETFPIVAHAVSDHILGVLAIGNEILSRLTS